MRSSIIKKLKKCVIQFFSWEVAPATFNIRRKYLKVFFDYLTNEGVIEENPINFSARKEEGRTRSIPIDVIKKLLSAPDQKNFTGLRDLAF